MTAMEPRCNFVIQMSGAPGSGKSTLANLLVQHVNGVVINHDAIKSFYLDMGLCFEQASQLTYGLDWILAEDMIKQGRSVIMDSPCNAQEVIDRGMALAAKFAYSYRYVECRVKTIDLLDERLRNRVPMRCQRTGVSEPPPDAPIATQEKENAVAQTKRWMKHPCRPEGDIIVVDATDEPDKSLRYILRQLGVTMSSESSDIRRQ